VEEAEGAVATGSQSINFEALIKQLHSCNTDLIKLERRWHFETILASSILSFIDAYKRPIANHQEVKLDRFVIQDRGKCNISILSDGNVKSEQNLDVNDFRNGKDFRIASHFYLTIIGVSFGGVFGSLHVTSCWNKVIS